MKAGAILLYKNVKVDETANVLSLQFNTGSYGAAQKVEFMLNDVNATPFASAYGTSNYDWLEFETTYTNLISSVAPGTYDIYVKFSGSGTSNFLSFGLLSERP